jgi:hypothetical protein
MLIMKILTKTILIEALKEIAKIPCQCNCGFLHFSDCTQTIAKKALEAVQQLDKTTKKIVRETTSFKDFEDDNFSEPEVCNCPICPCERRVQSFGDVCMNCSSGEHLG